MKVDSPRKPRRRHDAPKTFAAHFPSRPRSRRRHRGLAARLLGRWRFERRDVLVVAALLAVLALLLTWGYSDRLFDSFAGKPPSAVALPDGGALGPEP